MQIPNKSKATEAKTDTQKTDETEKKTEQKAQPTSTSADIII